MQFVIFVLPILLGFVFGYFFTTFFISAITILALFIAIATRPKSEQELGALIGVIIWVVLGLGTVAMWGTHFYVEGADLGLSSIGKLIFRQ